MLVKENNSDKYILSFLRYNPTLCPSGGANINFDSVAYFSISCNGNGISYLYDTSLQFTNKSIKFDGIFDANYDSSNRLAMCGTNGVAVYY